MFHSGRILRRGLRSGVFETLLHTQSWADYIIGPHDSVFGRDRPVIGMEYVAAQDAEDPGVLILSRFAGAAVECEAALLVNPYDPESVGSAIAQALAMPLEERRSRHDALFQVLMANDIDSWGERFLIALTRPVNLPNWLGQTNLSKI